jgi:hypothetical protein
VCRDCNNDLSLDEEYFAAFLGSVLTGKALAKSDKLQSRIAGSKSEYVTHDGARRLLWKPEYERIDRIVLKNARGHAFFEYGDPILAEPTYIWARPIEALNAEEAIEFEGLVTEFDEIVLSAWPEVGSRMMTRVLTGQDLVGDWVIVQAGVYRYNVSQHGIMRVRSVIREYLATEVYWGE